LNYENNGYFYSYDIEDNGAVTTFYGNAYYPQAGRNYMLGMSLRF
jgi:iron complex outermembrane receptor protein